MESQNSFGPRQMYQGNWTCSGCNGEITELPFQPDGTKPIFCRSCHQERRNSRPARSNFGGGAPRQMHQGDWRCNECGARISELPFMPKDEQSILCRDCYREKKGSSNRF